MKSAITGSMASCWRRETTTWFGKIGFTSTAWTAYSSHTLGGTGTRLTGTLSDSTGSMEIDTASSSILQTGTWFGTTQSMIIYSMAYRSLASHLRSWRKKTPFTVMHFRATA